MSLLECPHCRYQNLSNEVYCRQCQRPMRASGRATDTVVTSGAPQHPPEKRVKIWFDDEGEPHETLVDPEPEATAGGAPPAAMPSPVRSPSAAQPRTHIWFDDEGEPHESPIEEAPNHTRVAPRPKQVWFDDEGLPHDTPQGAAAANRSRNEVERTQVSPPPQTHSAFTQQLTPKPIYFERVETARDVAQPRQTFGQTVLRPAVQGAAARPAEATEPVEPPGEPATRQNVGTPQRTAYAPSPTPQPTRQAAPSPSAARQAATAPIPSARSSAGSLGTPVPQRVTSPSTAATPTARPNPHFGQASAQQLRTSSAPGATSTARPQARLPKDSPQEAMPGGSADPNSIDDVTTDKHPIAARPYHDLEITDERTVATPPPAQATVGASSSLASNYRAAAAHAAMADSAAANRSGLQDRRNPAQAPLIGVDGQSGPSAHTSVGAGRAVSTHTPFDAYPVERTVATPTPLPSSLASTLTPISGRASVAPHAPVVQRPTLTHTPVLMEDRSHQPPVQRTGGFFKRAPEPPVGAPSVASTDRPEPPAAAPAGGGFFNRVEPPPATPAPSHGFFSRPTEPVQPVPQSRRITDPIGTTPSPAPTPNPFSQGGLEARVTNSRDAVHDQATVVRDSPFLQSEPTVVRNPAPAPPEEEDLAGPMRRRLTEPMLARGPGFIAPTTSQGIVTERAPLWRLAIAAGIDGVTAAFVGMSTAAAEMLMFGGHWPTETTNPLDAFAMWMHNYPGTEKRAVLVMLLFAWAYAALGARTGRTMGRTVMRLIAIGQDGESITWPRAAWRSFVGLFSGLLFGAGYFWAIVDGQHRALHDIVSRSVVVTRKSA